MITFLKNKKKLTLIAFSTICIAFTATNSAYGLYDPEDRETGIYYVPGGTLPRLESLKLNKEEAKNIVSLGGFVYGDRSYLSNGRNPFFEWEEAPSYTSEGFMYEQARNAWSIEPSPEGGNKMQLIRRNILPNGEVGAEQEIVDTYTRN